MANMTGGQKLGTNQGKGSTDQDPLALFLKLFGGENTGKLVLRIR